MGIESRFHTTLKYLTIAGFFNDEGCATHADTLLPDPDPGHGNDHAIEGDYIRQFLGITDVIHSELIIEGATAVRVRHQNNLLGVKWMIQRCP